jgi:hypothetical protein
MSEEVDEGLVKVFVDLPNHWATGGESMWAKPLGNDEYELRNTPFYAYGLNWGDIVLAISAEDRLKPEVREVVRQSGNRTLRLYFQNNLDRSTQVRFLEDISELGLSYERATEILIALDIPSESNYEAICNHLWALENDGILEYETCESRSEGSFDDSDDPDDE